MVNGEKNKRVYTGFVKALNDFSSGESVPDLPRKLARVFNLLQGGYTPPTGLSVSSDYVGNLLTELSRYTSLLSHRKKVKIAGGEREIMTEEEALENLVLAESLARDLRPVFRRSCPLSCRVFHDIRNLSLAYVNSISGGVADEYISVGEAFNAKRRAVSLAKQGIRVSDLYDKRKEDCEAFFQGGELNSELSKFEKSLLGTSKEFMRSLENVAITPKHIAHEKPITRELLYELTSPKEGRLEFAPSVIFPVATGGTELGIRAANAYEDVGHDSVVYPLMFSMKTRKQRYPWVVNDSGFLEKSLEGHDALIVEDWVTTGNTLRGILQKIENVFPREIRVATLKRDPEKSQIPFLDHYRFYVGELAKYLGDKTDALADMDKP